jgi:hypothetical protein
MGTPRTYRDPVSEETERTAVKVEATDWLFPQPSENPVCAAVRECTLCARTEAGTSLVDACMHVCVCALVFLSGVRTAQSVLNFLHFQEYSQPHVQMNSAAVAYPHPSLYLPLMPTYPAPPAPPVFAPMPVVYPMGAVPTHQPILGPVGPAFTAIDHSLAFPLAPHAPLAHPIPIQFPVNPFAPEPIQTRHLPTLTFRPAEAPALPSASPQALHPLYSVGNLHQPRYE